MKKICDECSYDKNIKEINIGNKKIKLCEDCRNKLRIKLYSEKERDIDRISPFIKELENLWMKYPDIRFGQLIFMIQNHIGIDSFYMEDDIFLEYIKSLKI